MIFQSLIHKTYPLHVYEFYSKDACLQILDPYKNIWMTPIQAFAAKQQMLFDSPCPRVEKIHQRFSPWKQAYIDCNLFESQIFFSIFQHYNIPIFFYWIHFFLSTICVDGSSYKSIKALLLFQKSLLHHHLILRYGLLC